MNGRDGLGFEYDDDHVFDYMDDVDEELCDYCNNPLDECTCMDCGLGPDGQCSKAGTEECDWDCTQSHGPNYCGSEQWHQRHKTLPVQGCECGDCLAAKRDRASAIFRGSEGERSEPSSEKSK